MVGGPPNELRPEGDVGKPPSDAREALADPGESRGVPLNGGEGLNSPLPLGDFSPNPPHDSPPQLACLLRALLNPPSPLIDRLPVLSIPPPLNATDIELGRVAKPPISGLGPPLNPRPSLVSRSSSSDGSRRRREIQT